MEVEEVTELIETTESTTDDDVTLGENHDVYLSEPIQAVGRLTIEYKPRDWRVADDGLVPLAEVDFFEDQSTDPEQIISSLYWALVELLYPKSSYLDDPWDNIPLTVELTYETENGSSSYYYSLGSYR